MSDKQIIRELAKQYMEIATSEKQQKTNARMCATNDLKIVRPPVTIEEIPWYQMNIGDELTCICEDERARGVEETLRRSIYREKHFKSDSFFEPFLRVTRAFDSTGMGLEAEETILRTDDINNIISHSYKDLLEDEDEFLKMHIPEFTARPDKDEAAMEYFTDLLGDSMPAKLCGNPYIYFMPWDQIARLRGLEPIFIDLYERPEYLHRIISLYAKAEMKMIDFIEANGGFDPTYPELHCTPGIVSGRATDGTAKSAWFRGAAQGFGDVSPEMHKEFDIDYILPIAERFAYTYYGCCEPLDRKVDIIKKIPNLRKVGATPWANIESLAEQLGGDYVMARKPNPAHVAMVTDPEVIREEIESTVKAAIRYGCPMDIALKDISNVSHRPENLIVWSEVVSDVLDKYYGKE